MVNSEDFINRLKKIMEVHQLTASNFADKINVQRSSISHILSGRNKPSLDFVLKVTSVFEDVDMYWLLNGKGTYPKEAASLPSTPSLFENAQQVSRKSSSSHKGIERIVVFYSDGTFEEYNK
ncbi:helix-turn-helix protein [Lutibacter sp. Hel_I_33_5]|uniref:helix-turn-helix domain-containing protein n=1 Tax=Lutibacter sp. Hel_I_33_5 TaxID=1566289 RepID=UPI0011A700CD|nr:helix-turn-helix transcriptional regulator [Lutibacter sp. Hel_I_33_5]TVZ54911.1 helix-turn-helix protein [Lutibacter sp. Hel_I_33_5]